METPFKFLNRTIGKYSATDPVLTPETASHHAPLCGKKFVDGSFSLGLSKKVVLKKRLQMMLKGETSPNYIYVFNNRYSSLEPDLQLLHMF